MATKYTPDNRATSITINGKGPYIVTKLLLKEVISEQTTMVVDFVTDATFTAKDLGQTVSVTHAVPDKDPVNINLLSTAITYEGYSPDKELNHFQVTASDPLSILMHDTGSRIFQQKSTKDIITEIATNASLNNYFSFNVSGDGQVRDFCIQLHENSYDFICRLCAEEGWHFHCEFNDEVKLVIADSNQAFTEYGDNISYLNPTTEISEVVTSFANSITLGTNSIDLKDFSFQNAQTFDNQTSSSIAQSCTLSLMDYGTGTSDKSQITTLANTMLAGIDTQKLTFAATSSNLKLHCGTKFTLKNHPQADFNQAYVITSIEHELYTNESGINTKYHNSFTCIPASVTYKPRYIAKPCYTGTLTATVTGPSDKEIYTDDLGRIKVLLHFDRVAQEDENSSIWVPVAQAYAANGFGSFFLPRVGTTVVLTFLNGDIDKPIVLSSIYTDNTVLPFSSSTQSGFKTHSYPNGENASCNELRFEDQKDSEQVYIHAQKDLVKEIENDATETLKGSKTIIIEKQFTTSAKEEVAHSTEKSYTITAKEDYSVSTEANSVYTTKGKQDVTVSGAYTVKTDDSYSLTAKKDVTVDGNAIAITGKNKITLKVGSSSIEISSSGITINATKITIKGTNVTVDATKLEEKGSGQVAIKGAQISIKADATAELSGLKTDVKATTMTTVEGTAMLTLKGGLTRIN